MIISVASSTEFPMECSDDGNDEHSATARDGRRNGKWNGNGRRKINWRRHDEWNTIRILE